MYIQICICIGRGVDIVYVLELHTNHSFQQPLLKDLLEALGSNLALRMAPPVSL